MPGTKKLIEKYGADLVCVRYKYDTESRIKIKTVELILDRQIWEKENNKIPPNKLVSIQVVYGEAQIGRLVRAAGGQCDRNKKVWQLPYREVVALGFESRIVKE
jgi:hypothetical protein